MNPPPAIGLIVTRFSRLKQLKDQAEHFVALDRELKAHLGDPLTRHVRIAAVRDGCLVIQADSGAWASELRFKTPEILAALSGKPGFGDLRSIRIRMFTDHAPERAQPVRRARISAAAAASLEAHAAGIEDESVRNALLRIASRKDVR